MGGRRFTSVFGNINYFIYFRVCAKFKFEFGGSLGESWKAIFGVISASAYFLIFDREVRRYSHSNARSVRNFVLILHVTNNIVHFFRFDPIVGGVYSSVKILASLRRSFLRCLEAHLLGFSMFEKISDLSKSIG